VDGAVLTRLSFRFSADGGRAACLAAGADGEMRAETWRLTANGPVPGFTAGLRCDPLYTSVLPVDDDQALLSWHGIGAEQHVAWLRADGRRRLLGTHEGPAVRLISSSVAWSPSGKVYRVGGDGPWLAETAGFPGGLRDVLADGDRLVACDGAGGLHPPVTTPGPVLRMLAYAGGRALLVCRDGARARLVLQDLATGETRTPGDDRRLRGEVHPVALDPTGERVALIEAAGARSLLSVWHSTTGEVRPVAMPDGELLPVAGWTSDGLWLPFAAPDRPRALAWLPPGADALRLGEDTGPWADGHTETFPGADGPVEAVVYGPSWRTADQVVVALHGGPASRWTLGFEPLFQQFVTAGAAVIAPNQRGSTGYGAAHLRAIVGAWGVPDLADVTAIGVYVGEERPGRPRPALYGVSYGAYLAMLAATTAPERWSRCAAVAPFLSGPRLHADGYVTVRGMTEALGGLTEATDAIGPRDLERLSGGLRGPLLLVHGALDQSVPVGHSRLLADRATGPDTTYLELPDRGHDVFGVAASEPATAEVVGFLTAAGCPA
jgi:alpha-beta hydrolase superfamily lysophospholipase